VRARHSQMSDLCVDQLLIGVEKELAAFYATVFNMYGVEEARLAVDDWIKALEMVDWPVDGALPNWRQVTIVAADCLATRISNHPSKL
jgi:hypothetical protein